MPRRSILRHTALAVLLLSTLTQPGRAAPAPETSDVTQVMRRVFDWQVANRWSDRNPIEQRGGTRGWVRGAFLTGVMEAYRATGDTAYLDFARSTAQTNDWKLGSRERHADDHIVGQTYIELHRLEPAPGQLDSTRATLDRIIATPVPGRELWSWCDALYMAPPTFAKLTEVTGDPVYLAAADTMYWDVYDALYDPDEHLFFRDERFIAPKDGRKIFWSRGNGWVLAGLARLLDVMPAEHPSRPRYIALFREMSARLVALQPADGLWRSNLLQPEDSHGESSGSGFFCYALAWGVNQKILTDAAARGAAERAWDGLIQCINVDGRLGWVQPIGAAPGAFDENTWQEYGSGAFLAAGSQMMKLH